MKHLRIVTKNHTAKAATWQDTLCVAFNFIGVLFGSFGAASPALDVVLDKCDPTTE